MADYDCPGQFLKPNMFLIISKPGHHLESIKNAVIASLPIHMCNKNECWNYALKLGSSFDTQDVTYANFAMHTSCSHEMPIWLQE